jgi:hypothetical protein
MSYELGDELTDELSDCCDAPITDTGFCNDCKEHVI